MAGVVFVDSSHPDQFELLRQRKSALSSAFVAGYAMGSESRRYEYENTKRIPKALERAGRFPDVPCIVLSAGELAFWESSEDHEWWLELRRDLSTMSARGEWREVASSGHFIQREAPEVVAAAIVEILEEVR